MVKYVIKRIIYLIPTMIAVSFIVFVLMDLTPGDPALSVAGDQMTDEQIEVLREEMGLNDNIFVRYGRYMLGVLQGDFGKSIHGGQDVWESFATRFPYTLYLAVVSMALTVIVAVPLGIVAAIKQNTWVDAGLSAFAVLGMSMPNYWLGLLLILLFSVNLGWLPSTGAEHPLSIIMPAVTTALPNLALIVRTTRSAMLDVIRQDYLRTARAKGVSENNVINKHALNNAWIPIITMIGSQFSYVIGGVVVVETVFAWPGIGYLTVTAIKGTDFTMVTGCVILTTVFVAIVLLIVDIAYAFVDPRVKASYT